VSIEPVRAAGHHAALHRPDVIERDGKLLRRAGTGARSDDGGWRPFHSDNIPPASLRPHSAYLELCGPIVETGVSDLSERVGMREPLLVTRDGTILDGHVRWHVAIAQGRASLPCIVCDLTEVEALQVLIERHSTSKGLNAFRRIVLALGLEPFFRAGTLRAQPGGRADARASNLTKVDRIDVRVDIARVAGVSTGNVTKVKQLLETVIPEIREGLRRGEVSIHRAWQWRCLSPKHQREALWQHRHRKDIRHVIRRLITQHMSRRGAVPTADQVRAVLQGLKTHALTDAAVVVADLPGKAIVVTRECYDALLREAAP